jgi:hypothetical protein
MDWLQNLLILAVFSAPGTSFLEGPADSVLQQRHPDAVEVFYCDFNVRHNTDVPWDVNYDLWPDQWSRIYGPGLPHYVPVEIEDDLTAQSGKCLTVRLNGGGAHVLSPAVGVSDKFSYKIETLLRVEGVKNSRAQVRVEFCDEQREVIQVAESPWFRATGGWEKIHIGPVNPSDERIRLARLVLFVESGLRPDLQGAVSLGDVWIARLPKMVVSTNSPFNVYEDPRGVEVTCELSGILEKNPDILFELLDASSQRIDDSAVRLDGRLITERLSHASDIVDGQAPRRAGYAGSTSWRPPIEEHGHYRVRVTMKTAAGLLNRKVISIAVVPPLERPPRGEFGWSLAGDELPLSFEHLRSLLPRVSVNWVKLPVWYGPSETSRGDELVAFTEQLAASDIEVVGVVDDPPAESELAQRMEPGVAIADTLSRDTGSWLPLLDPVLTRLSLRVRWWQLGDDYDSSFCSFPRIEEEVAALRNQLFRFGQDVNLGIGWHWSLAPNDERKASWDFQQFSASPALTGNELAAYLQLPHRAGVRRWVLIEPLPRDLYDLETRARDLLEQILAAKIHQADAIFAAHPFDDQRGLMLDNGTPGDLLLPWRTTASLLGGATYLGSIRLPQGSPNRLFETPEGDVIMVVWADGPVREAIHLGSNIKVVDAWGRTKVPKRAESRQLIEVDRMPIFVRGLNPAMAKIRMSTRFQNRSVPSIFGKGHPNKLFFTNAFPQGVGGAVRVVAPAGWSVSPDRIDFKLGNDATGERDFEISLPFDANSGVVPVRIDFDLTADQNYRFSVYRELIVGDGRLDVDIHSRLEENGDLVIEQRMINHAPELVDFKCLLYAPDRRRQRLQVFRLGGSPDVKVYRYQDAEDLVGAEMWLRMEEIDGPRVLNYRFTVEP